MIRPKLTFDEQLARLHHIGCHMAGVLTCKDGTRWHPAELLVFLNQVGKLQEELAEAKMVAANGLKYVEELAALKQSAQEPVAIMTEQQLRAAFFAATGRIATSDVIGYQAFLCGFKTATQTTQKPAAWINEYGDLLRHHPKEYGRDNDSQWVPLYTAPQPTPDVEAALKLAREALKYIAVVDGCSCGVPCDCYAWAILAAKAKETLTAIDAALQKGRP